VAAHAGYISAVQSREYERAGLFKADTTEQRGVAMEAAHDGGARGRTARRPHGANAGAVGGARRYPAGAATGLPRSRRFFGVIATGMACVQMR